MKILSWNCNGALRKKLHQIIDYDADVYVIQECENPQDTESSEYKNWATNYIWTGDNKNKGLGIFAKSDINLEAIGIEIGKLESFIPCKVNGQVLLGVWTKQANSPTFGYIGQMWKFLQSHKSILMDSDAIIIGDFNSNASWDVWDRWWNHSDVVRELEDIGCFSLYHWLNDEKQGAEQVPTFYMHKKLEKPYHIDYAFLPKKWLGSSTLEIGSPDIWLAHSDHMPLLVSLRGSVF